MRYLHALPPFQRISKLKNKIGKFVKSAGFKIGLTALFYASAILLESFGISVAALALYILSLACCGGGVFIGAIKGILRRDLLDEKFLMSIASVGAMAIGKYREGVAVMLFFLVGETFEHMAVRKSRNSIKSLMDICPDEANIMVDGEEVTVDAEDVEVDNILIIRPGQRVAVDSVVISGNADVDTSSMTGESMPVSVSEGSSLCSGYILTNGFVYARATATADQSSAARILELVENANENKSREEAFITRFSRYYTPAVVILALCVAILPWILGFMPFSRSLYTALTFLVISCPCALVISVPMAFFGGIGGAASQGILYKGGNVFSKVATVDTVAFDKTGTITNGRFEISDVKCFGVEREELLSIAASVEYASAHPVAECIKNSSSKIVSPDSVNEIAGYGIVASFGDDECAVGNIALMHKLSVNIDESLVASGPEVYVSRNGSLIGIIIISDTIKSEAKETFLRLKGLGVKRTVILSGDREQSVKNTAEAVNADEYHFALKPSEKYEKLEQLISSSKSTMYVGDGINDSPSLARADVGVAMGALGQDSAIEAADMVIMTDNLYKIPQAVLIARKTIQISRQNIVFALGSKGLILLLGLLGFANMWLAVFADVGVAVLAILNSTRALKAPKI